MIFFFSPVARLFGTIIISSKNIPRSKTCKQFGKGPELVFRDNFGGIEITLRVIQSYFQSFKCIPVIFPKTIVVKSMTFNYQNKQQHKLTINSNLKHELKKSTKVFFVQNCSFTLQTVSLK